MSEHDVVVGDGYAVGSLDALGEGYGFRKKNVGEGDAVYVIAGGKDGYVGRDGRLADGATSRGAPGAA